MPQPARHLELVQESTTDPLIGTSIDGRYVIEKVLGEGGMGMVYRARHAVLDKPLAIKVLKPSVSRNEEVMERFRREAQAASSIGSPHICDVSDFGALPDGSTYFVMEFLDGPSLGKAMEDGAMPTEQVARIGTQLCDALGAAHNRGIVHRDLKPDNVHLVKKGNRDDFVKVLDFGIAKVATNNDSKLTQAGQVFGTPHYMSPEQCAGHEVDHRTDIYALGVILYEMACGKVPFDADNLMGLLTKHVYEQPIPLRQMAPNQNIDPGLEAVIMRCLHKNPDGRHPTMADLKGDLERVLQGSIPDSSSPSVNGLYPQYGPGTSGVTHAAPSYPGGSSEHLPRVAAPETTGGGGSVSKWMFLGAAVIFLAAAGAFAIAFLAGSQPSDEDRVTIEAPENTDNDTTEPDEPDEPDTVTVTDEVADSTDVTTDDSNDAPAEPVMVSISSNPPGAEVHGPNGALIGNTPISLPRPSGGDNVVYTLQLAGYQDRTVALSQHSQPEVRVNLQEARRTGGRRPHRPTTSNTTASTTPVVTPMTNTGTTPSTNTPSTTSTTTSSSSNNSPTYGSVGSDDLMDPFRDRNR